MRTTIKVFVRTEEKKREASKPKDAGESAPPTPVDAKPGAGADALQVTEHAAVAPVPEDAGSGERPPAGDADNSESAGDGNQAVESHVCAIHPSCFHTGTMPAHSPNIYLQENAVSQQSNEDGNGQEQQATEAEKTGDEATKADEGEEEAQQGNQRSNAQGGEGATAMSNSFNPSFGLGGMNGSFPNMNFGGGDMNQMQMMMAMQNGMMPPGFGGFQMMGKSLNIVSASSPI